MTAWGELGSSAPHPYFADGLLRAHMNVLQFACNVPIETERYVPVAPRNLQFLFFEPLPRLRHCPGQDLPIMERRCREHTENRLVAVTIGLASYLHWISKYSFGVVLVKQGKVG